MNFLSIRELLDQTPRPGTVVWLGLRPARRAPMAVVEDALLDPASGVAGDHYAGRAGTRQVSVIGQEALAAIASFLDVTTVPPEALRRNVVIAGLNLAALKGRDFALGEAVLRWTGECHPCSRMEETLGPGGYNAVRGHGGILARVIAPGRVRLCDAIRRCDHQSPS